MDFPGAPADYLHFFLGFAMGCLGRSFEKKSMKAVTMLPQAGDTLSEILVPGYKEWKGGVVNAILSPILGKELPINSFEPSLEYFVNESVDIALFCMGYSLGYSIPSMNPRISETKASISLAESISKSYRKISEK